MQPRHKESDACRWRALCHPCITALRVQPWTSLGGPLMDYRSLSSWTVTISTVRAVFSFYLALPNPCFQSHRIKPPGVLVQVRSLYSIAVIPVISGKSWPVPNSFCHICYMFSVMYVLYRFVKCLVCLDWPARPGIFSSLTLCPPTMFYYNQ